MRQDPCLSARCCDRILKKGWAQEGQSTTPFLPDLSLTDYAALLFPNNQRFDEEFIASPTWQVPHVKPHRFHDVKNTL